VAASTKIQRFRSKVALLKRKGLIPSTVNTRRALPDTPVKGRGDLRALVAKYDDVLSGKATPVKVPLAQLRIARKQGYATSQGRVIVPHSATERASRRGKYFVVRPIRRDIPGLERVQIPVPFHEVTQWFLGVKAKRDEIDAMKEPDEWFGFWFGYQGRDGSTNLYGSIEQAIDAFEKGESSFGVVDANSYQHLSLVRVIDDSKWIFPAEHSRARSVNYNRRAQRRHREKMKKSSKGFDYLTKQARDQKNYRQRLTGEKLEEYKKKANERAKKSRERRKTKI
jgi:hypothetical protein